MVKHGRGWFVARGLVALALHVGFYVGGVTIGLVALGLALVTAYERQGREIFATGVLLAIACFTFYATFASPFARGEKVEAPGPELDGPRAPELLALVRDVAARMRTAPPSRVFLVAEANAYVVEHGGFLGFGARRWLAIGLPLLHAFDRTELVAVLAHELGHYAAGDTRLAGIAYRTRRRLAHAFTALSGTPTSLGIIELGRGIVQWLVTGYAKLYLRATATISQAQELAADEASVALGGRDAAASALTKVELADAAYTYLLVHELVPFALAGAWPSDVWGAFRALFDREDLRAEVLAAGRSAKTDPYDTHPSISDRTARIASLPDPGVARDPRPALDLVKLDEALVAEVERMLTIDERGQRIPLRPAGWDEAGAIHGRLQYEVARVAAAALHPHVGGSTFLDMSRAVVRWLPERGALFLAIALDPRVGGLVGAFQAEVAEEVFVRNVGAVVGVALVEIGGAWHTDVGKPLVVRLGGVDHDPFALARAAALEPGGIDRLGKILHP